jgi:hypothetical protein
MRTHLRILHPAETNETFENFLQVVFRTAVVNIQFVESVTSRWQMKKGVIMTLEIRGWL